MKRDLFDNDNSIVRWSDEIFDNQADTFRMMNELIIWRNLLFYCGEQYLEYLRSTRSFRRRSVPDFTPTPVSNEVREYVRTIKSMLLNQKMVPRVWPNTGEKEDEQAAQAGQKLLVSMDNANDAQFRDECEKNIIWMCLSGTSFMRVFPDADGGLWMPDGGKTGDVGCESVLPFNVRLDNLGDSLKKKRWVAMQSLKDREWVEDTFRVKIDKVDDDKTYMDYEKTLSKLVSNVSPYKGMGMNVNNIESYSEDDLVLYREIEFKPTSQFRQGRYMIVCGKKKLVDYPRMLIRPEPGYWDFSLTDFHFNYVPGRYWSDAPVSDIISPQNIINEIDQALSINRKGIGRPRLISPGDVGLKRMDLGGHGFLAMTYNPIMGQKPEIHEGTPLPVQVLEERRLQKEQLQDTAGDPKNVLKGKAPSANASGILTDVLRETAEAGKYPDVDRYNRSLTRVYKKRLLVAQEVMPEERIIKTIGRGNKPEIMRFKAADLKGNTDVRLELDSGLITTKSGQAQMLLNLVQAGFFQDETTTPSVRQEVLQRMGMTTFSDEHNADVERAEQENVAVAMGDFNVMTTAIDPATGEEMVVTDDPMFGLDNHPVHYEIHRKYILSGEFKELPVECQVTLMKHAETHKNLIDSAPPDIRDYVQIDKLLAANVLSPNERAQLMDKYLGIQADMVTELGIPGADTVTKVKQKLSDTQVKESTKRQGMNVELIKTGMVEGTKRNAIRSPQG